MAPDSLPSLTSQIRNPNNYARSGGNTSDLFVDGELWDLKRVTSPEP